MFVHQVAAFFHQLILYGMLGMHSHVLHKVASFVYQIILLGWLTVLSHACEPYRSIFPTNNSMGCWQFIVVFGHKMEA